MESQKRLIVFHRNRLFRDCLATFLDNEKNYDVSPYDHDPHDHDADDWKNRLLESGADILLLDVNLAGGLAVEVTRMFYELAGGTKIILLVPDEHDYLSACMAMGVHGCVLERSSLSDLREAIHRVLSGDKFCSPDFVASMFAEIQRLSKPTAWVPPSLPDEPRLTSREIEVMELLNQRKSNKEIASKLCVSLFTVKNHVRNILEKLDVDNRMEAVDVARKRLDLAPPMEVKRQR
ncbi:Transcriptional regulatory protein DegU [Stieleria maiorica]|uniref:Transcriptional regulatory protein DegU n=1 Tax=Stieleria maiorica TaxID=2795974 RepID=A0A5B9MJ15_9BACT|nr:response regulator transcription factor [Stieleria maiorica]QEG01252.1 Transcriptional regulatory protein DegU [Stieleria maiorica]